MMGASIAAASMLLVSSCPPFSTIDRSKQERTETEVWLKKWSDGSWRGAPISDQRFRFTVTGSPLQRFGYELRGWRTEKNWRVFVRKLDARSPHRSLRHFPWRERHVDPETKAKIDAIWRNDCLWSTPRLRLSARGGGGKYVWHKLAAADWIDTSEVDYDFERPGQVWLGEQGAGFAEGFPPKFATLILKLAVPTESGRSQ